MILTGGVGEGLEAKRVNIRALPNASKQTKNHLNGLGENPLQILNWPDPDRCNWTSDSVLFRTENNSGFAGWIVAKEIEIT